MKHLKKLIKPHLDISQSFSSRGFFPCKGGIMSGIKEENERKKEYLMSYLPCKRMVKNMENQLKELRVKKMYPGMNMGDGLPHGSRTADMSDYMVAEEKLIEDILKKRSEYIRKYTEIHNTIHALDAIHAEVLELKYLNRLNFTDICKRIGYEKTKVYQLHGEALRMLVIPETEQASIEKYLFGKREFKNRVD